MDQHPSNKTVPTKKKRVSKKKVEASLSLAEIKELLLFVSVSTSITEFSIGTMSMKFDREAQKKSPNLPLEQEIRATMFQPPVRDSSIGIWGDTFGGNR